MEHMDADKFKSRMHSLAYGNVMAAAARNYQREMLEEQAAGAGPRGRDIAVDDLLDDPELERLHAERLGTMQREAEERAAKERKGHGELQEVGEGDFMEITTTTPLVVCHFHHPDFERCKLLNGHLRALASKFFETRFISLQASDAPFFSVKLKVKVLPCLLLFRDGVNTDRVVGFEDYGKTDSFPTAAVEARLRRAGVVADPPKGDSDKENELLEHYRTSVYRNKRWAKGDSDEDSDFD